MGSTIAVQEERDVAPTDQDGIEKDGFESADMVVHLKDRYEQQYPYYSK